MEEIKNTTEVQIVEKTPKKRSKFFASSSIGQAAINPWTPAEQANVSQGDPQKVFLDKLTLCRFFYRTEPIISTVINKLVEVGINDIVFKKKGLSDNEFRIFLALKPKFLEFAETLALEYLLSGLSVPDVSYGHVQKEDLIDFGVKKYQSLVIPTSMFVRDPKTIQINTSMLTDQPSIYVTIPGDVISFVKGKGTYADGNEDKELYNNLKTYFPLFIKAINRGDTSIQLDPNIAKLAMRRRSLTDDAYPIPYVSPVLDALQHKRQLRRMDYFLIDKVIGAILHVTVGNDNFPVTESEEDATAIENLRTQLAYKFNTTRNLERTFQLITNHTVSLNWVFPDTKILLDQDKYKDIDQEILFGLGFPQMLITGETTRSGSSHPEFALLGPTKTMENFRRKISYILTEICREVATRNHFSSTPEVYFKAINLHAFADFTTAMDKLYGVSGVSRTSYAEELGYDFDNELTKLIGENTALEASGLPAFGQTPNSRPPTVPGVQVDKTVKSDTTTTKPQDTTTVVPSKPPKTSKKVVQ